MGALTLGTLTGLGLAISTGPVFLTLIQVSVSKGFQKSIFFILGVSTADLSMLMISWFGLYKLDLGIEEALLKLLGGIALIIFGATFIYQKKEAPKELIVLSNERKKRKSGSMQNAGLFMKGLLINAINPIVWAFWLGISQLSVSKFGDATDQFVYFLGILSVVLLTDITKGYYAQKLSPFLSSKFLRYFNLGIGIVLIGIGLKFSIEYTM
ncbi:MAG: LysE family transporter [Cyclobacteriaceae bacterium]